MEYVYFMLISITIISLYLVFSFYKQYNLKESFKASNPKKDCTGKIYIDKCDNAQDNCEDYWSFVPDEGPTGKNMKSAGKAMGCNYSGEVGCSFKTNNNGDKVNDNWLCKDGTYNDDGSGEDSEPEPDIEPEPDTEPEPDIEPEAVEVHVCRQEEANQYDDLELINGNNNIDSDETIYRHAQTTCKYKGCLEENATDVSGNITNDQTMCNTIVTKTVTNTPYEPRDADDIDHSKTNNWNEKCKTQWGSPDAWEEACESVTDGDKCKTGTLWVLDKNGKPYLCEWNQENEKCMNKESCYTGSVNLDYRNGLRTDTIGGTSVLDGCDNIDDDDEDGKLRCQLAHTQDKMHI